MPTVGTNNSPNISQAMLEARNFRESPQTAMFVTLVKPRFNLVLATKYLLKILILIDDIRLRIFALTHCDIFYLLSAKHSVLLRWVSLFILEMLIEAIGLNFVF